MRLPCSHAGTQRNALFLSIQPLNPALFTLSLHDALPIFPDERAPHLCRGRCDRRARFVFDCHGARNRKSTRLNSSHVAISYAVFCLKKKMNAYGVSFQVASQDQIARSSSSTEWKLPVRLR